MKVLLYIDKIVVDTRKIKMKGDVGMVCQKVYKQGRIKVMVSIQSPVPTSFHKGVKM